MHGTSHFHVVECVSVDCMNTRTIIKVKMLKVQVQVQVQRYLLELTKFGCANFGPHRIMFWVFERANFLYFSNLLLFGRSRPSHSSPVESRGCVLFVVRNFFLCVCMFSFLFFLVNIYLLFVLFCFVFMLFYIMNWWNSFINFTFISIFFMIVLLLLFSRLTY